RQMPIAVLVHDVRNHVIPLTLNFFFAGMMKVELNHLIRMPADRYLAARSVVRLNAVAVVNDLQRRGPVVELERWQRRFLSALNVDRRLFFSQLACAVVGFDFAPVTRPFGSAVRPFVASVLFLW